MRVEFRFLSSLGIFGCYTDIVRSALASSDLVSGNHLRPLYFTKTDCSVPIGALQRPKMVSTLRVLLMAMAFLGQLSQAAVLAPTHAGRPVERTEAGVSSLTEKSATTVKMDTTLPFPYPRPTRPPRPTMIAVKDPYHGKEKRQLVVPGPFPDL